MESLKVYNSKYLGTNARVHPKLHQGIVEKVRHFNRRSSPSGCAQNVKAEVRDIDKAVEANRLRERMVDTYAENELKKLNLYKSKDRRFNKSLTMAPTSPKKTGNILKKKFSIIPVKPKTADFYHKRSLTQTFNAESLIKTFSVVASPRPLTGVVGNKNKLKRLASLDAIMKSCDELKPKLKPHMDLLENHQQEMKETSNDFKQYLADLDDCLRLADDEKKMEKLMEACKNSRKFSKVAEIEPDIKDDMLRVTRKLIQLGGNKVWRHNHTEFMASAEKIINSIPKVRS